MIELLVVMGIISILAGLLMAVLGPAKQRAKITQARLEMSAITTALHTYIGTYNRAPMPATVQTADFTFGNGTIGSVNNGFKADNSELMSILLSEDRLSNAGYVRNPQKVVCLNAHRASVSGLPGVGPDLVYRDPWGNPYMITMDYDYDNRCRDAFYSLAAVSSDGSPNGGYNGLYRTPPNTADTFEVSDSFMIWSLGPDGKADPTVPATRGVNKDNILGWSK